MERPTAGIVKSGPREASGERDSGKAGKLDCLLIHAPISRNYYPLLGSYSSVNWMSQSLLGLADALSQAGLRTRVIHLGLERAVSSRFSIEKYLEGREIASVAFSMHFHQQISDVLENAAKIKAARPDVFILLGGMTATFFCREILEGYPQIDAVIRGEAEGPLPETILKLKEGKGDFSGVPNLSWRRGEEIVDNPEVFTATAEDLNSLSFTHLDYLEHYPLYLDFPKAVFNTRLPSRLNFKLSRALSAGKRHLFGGLAMGRGCYGHCFYCGGGNRAQQMLNQRRGVIFRSRDRVIESIRELKDYGYSGTYISFDPHPESQTYYPELFRKMRGENLDFDIIFSAWSLPTRTFFEEFGKTFGPGSSVGVSPESGSEKVRRKARGNFYSNAELIEAMDHCEEQGIRMTVWFSLGVPGEEKEDFEETLKLKDHIDRNYQYIRKEIFLIEMEPCSPWYLDPEKFGIKVTRHTLEDFIREQTDPDYSSMSTLGYTRDEHFGEKVRDQADLAEKLLKIKCDNFCEKRNLCRGMSLFWKTTRFLHLT